MSEIIYLSNVRLSFPHLVEPQSATEGGVKKYSADFIMEQNHPSFAQFMQQCAALAQGKWAEHSQNVLNIINGDRKLRCFGNGNEKIDKKTFQPYTGYANMAYVSANNDQMPQMIQDDGKPVDAANTLATQAIARKLYAGCYVNAAVKPWVQDNKHGRGMRCTLVAIQFAKDGEAFGEAPPDLSAMFGAVASPAPQGFGQPAALQVPAAPFPGFAPAPQQAPAMQQVQQGFAAPQAMPAAPFPGFMS